jgi:hypothetical protein
MSSHLDEFVDQIGRLQWSEQEEQRGHPSALALHELETKDLEKQHNSQHNKE